MKVRRRQNCCRCDLHRVKSLLRIQQFLSQSTNSPHLTDSESSLLHSQQPDNFPYPQPDKSNPRRPIQLLLRFIVTLYSHQFPGYPVGLLPSDLPAKILHVFLFSPVTAIGSAHLVFLDFISLIKWWAIQIIVEDRELNVQWPVLICLPCRTAPWKPGK